MAFSVDEASSSSSSCPSDFTSQKNYQVFLSFRGEDTRRGFTDHLYASLQRRGIVTFRDDPELERGEVISSELIKAIEGSMFAIIVLSQNYAFSTWCLDELQKIVECKKILGQAVFPIFYGVEPCDVRHQRGFFEEAFRKHEERFGGDKEKVQRWRDALREVANISGWDSKDQHEAELIESIVEVLYRKLQPKLPYYKSNLIGIDSRVEEVTSLLCMGSNDVRFIGIWGMGGIGKTTIAREVYERVQDVFEVSCFLVNVREVSETNGLAYIQRQLLSHLKQSCIDNFNLYDGKKTIRNHLCKKKVILVLDDVNELSQLENLAGKDWFGPGSRVVITTRDKHLLITHGVLEEYKVGGLNHDEALQLFCQKAFKRDEPKEGYLDLSKDVVKHAGGLPLALEVFGSFLCGRTVNTWHSALEQIKNIPDPKILDKLKISYDGLHPMEKNMFLDIACFFKGMDKHEVIEILENCGHFPEIGIEILIEKSLLTLRCDKLWMHDLLQEMGKNIVFQEAPSNPGRRSRLWSQEDINNVLVKNKGTEAIQALVLDIPQGYVAHWNPEAFSKTSELKLLKLCSLELPLGLKCLPSALNVLDWIYCPLKTLPLSLQLDELVDLKLCHSKIEQLWDGRKFLESLKSIDLSFSKNLIRSPDISGVPNLERLVLVSCASLFEVHSSLGLHRKLVLVNFKDCKNLKSLPTKMEMSSMEILILSGCSKVRKLPEFGGSMEHLSMLLLEGTSITELPLSIGCLIGLAVLNLKDCKNLVCLPSTIHNLKSLRILNISGCSKISRLPENLREVKCLVELDASETGIEEVPSCIFDLKNLKVLSFEGCQGLVSKSWNWLLPFGWILGSHLVPKGLRLPHSLSTISSLQTLNLSYCNLSEGSIPTDMDCLSSLKSLNLSGNNFISLPSSISKLSKLEFLVLNCCNLSEGSIPSDMDCLSSLKTLHLSGNNFISLPSSISKLSKLEVLVLNCCERLQLLPELPLSIESLDACNCSALESSKFNPSKPCNFFPLSEEQVFTGSDIDAMNIFMVLQRIRQEHFVLQPRFEMLIQGDTIPSWFEKSKYRCVAAVHVPRIWPLTEWVGFALCFGLVNWGYPSEDHRHEISCYLYGNNNSARKTYICSRYIPHIELGEPHLYILYFPGKQFRDKIYEDNDRNEIEFVLKSYCCGGELEIIGCGSRLVYQQDVEGLNKAMGQCSNSVFPPIGENLKRSMT